MYHILPHCDCDCSISFAILSRIIPTCRLPRRTRENALCAMDWPPLNSLPELVNMAVDNIRLFMYPIPPELVEKIGLDLNATW